MVRAARRAVFRPQEELLQRFDPSLVIYAEDYYRSLLDTIVSGGLGGAIADAGPIRGFNMSGWSPCRSNREALFPKRLDGSAPRA